MKDKKKKRERMSIEELTKGVEELQKRKVLIQMVRKNLKGF